MIDFYLHSPPTRRYLLDVESTKLLARSGASIVIEKLKSLNNSLASTTVATREHYQDSSLGSYNEKTQALLGDKLYRAQLSSDGKSLALLEHASAVIVLFSNESRAVTANISGTLFSPGAGVKWSTELIRLNVAVKQPKELAVSESPFHHISDLFIRDPSLFGNPPIIPSSITKLDQERPGRFWRAPQFSCFRPCFVGGLPAEVYSTRAPLIQDQTYIEILSFHFVLSAPTHDDTSTDAGVTWWKYRAALVSLSGCGSIRLMAYPDLPSRVDLALEWDKADNTTAAHAEAVIIQCWDSLAYHLLANHLLSPLSGVRSDSLPRNTAWAEVVDFRLPASATVADLRAFEFYIHDFCRTMANDPFVDQPVSAIHVGWIDVQNRPKTVHALESPSVGAPESLCFPPVTYRIHFSWTGQNAEEQWVRKFVEDHYEILGYLAHAVALVAEDVRQTTFTVHEELKSNFEGAGKSTDSDEDLGF